MVGRMQVREDRALLQVGALEPDQVLDVLRARVDVAVGADLQQRPAGRRDVVLDRLEVGRDVRRVLLVVVVDGGSVAAGDGRVVGQRRRLGGGDFALLDGMYGAGVRTVGRALGAAVALLEQLAVLGVGVVVWEKRDRLDDDMHRLAVAMASAGTRGGGMCHTTRARACVRGALQSTTAPQHKMVCEQHRVASCV